MLPVSTSKSSFFNDKSSFKLGKQNQANSESIQPNSIPLENDNFETEFPKEMVRSH